MEIANRGFFCYNSYRQTTTYLHILHIVLFCDLFLLRTDHRKSVIAAAEYEIMTEETRKQQFLSGQ